MIEKLKVRCKARPGLFDREYVITLSNVRGVTGGKFEFVADRSGVVLSSQPDDDHPVDAHVSVWSLGQINGFVRVQIPASSASEGRVLDVPQDLVAS